MITYESAALVIKIDTTDPAILHSQLMHSLIGNLKYSSSANPKDINYSEQILPLLQLLQTLMPDDKELSKAYA